MKKIILILAVMALLAGGWLFWRLAPSDESPDTLKLYGNVDIRQVSLAFEQGGRVTELFAEEGDRVTRGQLLARVDVTGLKLEADKLRADIAAQEQNLLKMKNGNRPEEIARAEAALRTAEASLEQAKRNDARMANLRHAKRPTRSRFCARATAMKTSPWRRRSFPPPERRSPSCSTTLSSASSSRPRMRWSAPACWNPATWPLRPRPCFCFPSPRPSGCAPT